ncbi:MAG: hypothetical protein MZU84_07910 [Sphingobacterium sp.]|nr:hypothetical protein [Sphingobacterium sp.]
MNPFLAAYVNQYIRKGANLIFVITNDGWWGNTRSTGSTSRFSRLRAVETRRSIACVSQYGHFRLY